MTDYKGVVMPLDPALRRQIRILLAAEDIEQQELASQTGLSPNTISKLITGKNRDTRISTLESIARCLGCTCQITFVRRDGKSVEAPQAQ